MHNPGILNFIKEKIANTKFYKTSINDVVIVSCFGEETYGELSKYAEKKLSADLFLLINTEKNSIKLSNITHKEFNFTKFASILELKGDSTLATGELNDKVIQFTKKLILC